MMPEDGRIEVSMIRGSRTIEEYADDMWQRRYPDPPSRSGRGWPLKRIGIPDTRRK